MAETAILMPLAVLACVVAGNLLVLVHSWAVLQDSVRTGTMLAMDSRIASAPCSASCANDEVRERMRQVGTTVGLHDSNIQLSDFWCGDGGWVSWQMPYVSWQPGQSILVCADSAYRPLGPFIPDTTLPLHAEMRATRYP